MQNMKKEKFARGWMKTASSMLMFVFAIRNHFKILRPTLKQSLLSRQACHSRSAFVFVLRKIKLHDGHRDRETFVWSRYARQQNALQFVVVVGYIRHKFLDTLPLAHRMDNLTGLRLRIKWRTTR